MNIEKLNEYLFGDDCEKATFAFHNIKSVAECKFEVEEHRTYDHTEKQWVTRCYKIEVEFHKDQHIWKFEFWLSRTDTVTVFTSYEKINAPRCDGMVEGEIEFANVVWINLQYHVVSKEMIIHDILSRFTVTNARPMTQIIDNTLSERH